MYDLFIINKIDENKICKIVLIYFACDTKAHEKVLNVQGPNSKAGCYYCNYFKGKRLNKGKKMVYFDHRSYLNENNELRNISIKYSIIYNYEN